ncbi:MAG: amidase [Actinomycetota bacterium]|nr:amidase [Actinomycetota bacterium]
MSLADETRWTDAIELARLVDDGEVTPAELLEATIERIEALNGDVNAVVLSWYDEARRIAGDDRLPAGPLRGVPFLLKDLHAEFAGQTMTNGNVALKAAGLISDRDTTIVSRYLAAGLVIAGRTNSCEMGSLPTTEPVANGPTRNPWNPDHIAGGSSGGAAAAVAAGMVPVAHASDGGGSIRIPASCCGLVGLKPSQGRSSLGPRRHEGGTVVEHCVSRSVRDTAAFLDAIAGPGVGDTVIAPSPERPYVEEVGADTGRLRIGMLDRHPGGGYLHDDCVDAVRHAAVMLEGLGHAVELEFPAALSDPDLQRRFSALWSTAMASDRARFGELLGRPLTDDEMEPVNRVLADYAENLSAMDVIEAMDAQVRFRRDVQQWWSDGWDLLLTPTLAEPPPRIGEFANDPDHPMAPMARAGRFCPFTPPFNTSGQPAISLPLHWNESGLPVGVQLVGAYGREDVLIRVASQLEATTPWEDLHPPLT